MGIVPKWYRIVAMLILVICITALGCSNTNQNIEEPVTVPPSDPTNISEVSIVPHTPNPIGTDPLAERSSREIYVATELGCGPADPAFDHPFDTRSATTFNIISEIHAGLFVHSADGEKVKPDLTHTFSVSEDFKRFEFEVRDGLKFSDGSPLSAADVKWSWERAFSKSDKGGRAADVFGSVAGAQKFRDGADEIHGIIVHGDRGIEVVLDKPRPDFTRLLADPVASVLKRENVESWPTQWDNGNGMADFEIPFSSTTMPIGAGAYRLVEYTPDQLVNICRLTINEHHWDEDVAIEHVIAVTPVVLDDGSVEFIDDQQSALEAGLIDYYLNGLSGVTRSKPQAVYGQHLSVTDAPKTWFIIFNPTRAPFDDIAFRRFLVASTNLSDVFPNAEAGTLRLVPSTIAGENADVLTIPFDLDAATNELALSKYAASGEQLISFRAGGLARAVLPPVFEQWQSNVNLDIHLRFDNPETTARDEPPMRLVFMAPAYPDPHAVLRIFSNPFNAEILPPELVEIAEMIDEASMLSNSDERRLRYAEIEQYILDNALAMPLRIDEYEFEFRTQPWLSNLTFPQFGGSVFRSVRIDSAAN